MPPDALRELLTGGLEAALDAVDARRCVRDALDRDPRGGEWHVVAIGKAAGAMCLGAAEHFDARLREALVVTKPGHVPQRLATFTGVRVLESAHPRPDERSLEAGDAVARFVQSRPARANVLFLVSGGASSLVERLVPGVTLADLADLNAWALASGHDIATVNAVRRAVSTLKGGGLARLAGSRPCRALLISDVPRDDPAVIGSGLLHAGSAGSLRVRGLPARLRRLVDRAAGAGRRARVPPVPYRIVASVGDACRAAAAHGRAAGFEARLSRVRFAGDARRLGSRFARRVAASPGGMLHVWGGESTVVLPARPGQGGRNQHLALAAARVIAGRRDVALLAAGTDGIDGVTSDAGGLVDGGTVDRGRDAGLDARRSLDGADSGRFLEASGDLLHTGPTLTNVGDLVLGVRGRSRRG